MKNRNWFWGVFFILAAVFVIAGQTGAFGAIGILSLLATVLLVFLVISSLYQLNFFGIFLPLALLYLIYELPLSLYPITFWQLMLIAVLISIGFSILFQKHPRRCVRNRHCERHGQTREDIDDNNPYAKVSFGSSNKYLHADNLKSGQFVASFGSLEVFFDQVQLCPNGAEILLDCSFGSIKLYIPKSWRVVDKLNVNLGGVDNNPRTAKPDENGPCLTLTGNVQLGGVEIEYI